MPYDFIDSLLLNCLLFRYQFIGNISLSLCLLTYTIHLITTKIQYLKTYKPHKYHINYKIITPIKISVVQNKVSKPTKYTKTLTIAKNNLKITNKRIILSKVRVAKLNNLILVESLILINNHLKRNIL